MALSTTTLSSSLDASSTTVKLTSTSGLTAGTLGLNYPLLLDGEFMFITSCPVSGTVKVRGRGSFGTNAVAHDVLAPVQWTTTPSDFPDTPTGFVAPRPPNVDDIVTCGQNGVIAVPTKNTTVLLTKGSALSSTTLAAPSKASDGVRLIITSETAYAHVITATTLLGDGASGSPHTTATYAAYIGASLILEAANGIWNVISNVGVTIS